MALDPIASLTGATVTEAQQKTWFTNMRDYLAAPLCTDCPTTTAPATRPLSSVARNAILNGDFNVCQRGTSFTSIANNTYAADRWLYGKGGTVVHDISRSTAVPTVAQSGRLFNYSLLLDCTTADAAMAAGDIAQILQRIEGYNWLPVAQRIFTISFWVKATKTGTYCVAFLNSGTDRSYVAEYTVNV